MPKRSDPPEAPAIVHFPSGGRDGHSTMTDMIQRLLDALSLASDLLSRYAERHQDEIDDDTDRALELIADALEEGKMRLH